MIESGGATFLALAKAAGELLAGDRNAVLVEQSRLRALLALLHGTSFGPALPPMSATLASGRELLTAALERVAETVCGQTDLQDLWRQLGAVTDDGIAPFILSAEGTRFFPTFEVDEQLPALLPQHSLGAALLRNLAAEDSEHRLDRMLLKRASMTAKAGLGFHAQVAEFYRDRLSSL